MALESPPLDQLFWGKARGKLPLILFNQMASPLHES